MGSTTFKIVMKINCIENKFIGNNVYIISYIYIYIYSKYNKKVTNKTI